MIPWLILTTTMVITLATTDHKEYKLCKCIRITGNEMLSSLTPPSTLHILYKYRDQIYDRMEIKVKVSANWIRVILPVISESE